MMSHPPLTKRVVAIDPSLKPANDGSEFLSTVGALLIAILLFTVPVGGGYWFLSKTIKDIQTQIAKAKHPVEIR